MDRPWPRAPLALGLLLSLLLHGLVVSLLLVFAGVSPHAYEIPVTLLGLDLSGLGTGGDGGDGSPGGGDGRAEGRPGFAAEASGQETSWRQAPWSGQEPTPSPSPKNTTPEEPSQAAPEPGQPGVDHIGEPRVSPAEPARKPPPTPAKPQAEPPAKPPRPKKPPKPVAPPHPANAALAPSSEAAANTVKPGSTQGPAQGESGHGGQGSGPGSGLGSGSGAGAGIGNGSGEGQGGKGHDQGGDGEGLFGVGDGPRFAKLVRPRYPKHAKENKKEGRVLLRLTIGAHGHLQEVTVVRSGGTDFDAAALESVRASTYVPATSHGKKIACRALLYIQFKLSMDNN